MESGVRISLRPYLSLFIFMKSEVAFQKGYETLKDMVENVNAEVVEPEEYLSDNVYFYDRNKNELRIYNLFEG